MLQIHMCMIQVKLNICVIEFILYIYTVDSKDQGKEAKFLKQGSVHYGKRKQTSTFMYYTPGL